MPSSEFAEIRACVFDAYGTLFDVHSAVTRQRARLGDCAEAVSSLWRRKQLEYSWLRSLMGLHADFWQVTGEALDFALTSHGVDGQELRQDLMSAYLSLAPYPEVRRTLQVLRSRGLPLAILSNGSPAMLQAAVTAADFADLELRCYSVEEIGVYKPDPRVYRLACEHLGLRPEQISFQSANGWDAAGAAAFGMKVAWINRSGQCREQLPYGPIVELRALDQLPALMPG